MEVADNFKEYHFQRSLWVILTLSFYKISFSNPRVLIKPIDCIVFLPYSTEFLMKIWQPSNAIDFNVIMAWNIKKNIFVIYYKILSGQA